MEEEKIEKILSSCHGKSIATSLLNDWYDHPRSIYQMPADVRSEIIPSPEEYVAWMMATDSLWGRVDSLIKEADLTLCLTSRYRYIRECKKWFEWFENTLFERG